MLTAFWGRFLPIPAFRLRASIAGAALLLCAQAALAADALNYSKNYFVTGDYAVAGVGLRGKGVAGFATGTINMNGVPSGADIVAAFLYWETVERTPAPSAANGFFDGKAIVGDVRGNAANPACWGTVGTAGPADAKGRVYRADVLRYLAIDHTNNVRLVNGPHTVKLPDVGGSGNNPVTNGATLLVVYRVLSLGTSLRAVVIYDGAYSMDKSDPPMTQTIGGFYQAASDGKMTQIAGNGQSSFNSTLRVNGSTINGNWFRGNQGNRWDNPTVNINLPNNAASFTTQVTSNDNQFCVTWAAIVASMVVRDTDFDGLLDVWETGGLHLNPGDATHPATFGGCPFLSEPCVNLPAMGALPYRQDIFVEADWLRGSDGHLHRPKLEALSAIADTFSNRLIALHFDVGNNYQSPRPSYIVPAAHAKGGEVIEESTLLCPNAQTSVCTYTSPYPVLSWKKGFRAVKEGFPALGLLPRFDNQRKDVFHYMLMAHALSGPFSPTGVPLFPDPKSISGVADRPGGDFMVTLGLWRSDNPADDQTGSMLIQAGTIMHELGHNLGLSHAGLYRTPNCTPNYLSVMNYMYQTRGLTDAQGLPHVDFSWGIMPPLNENSLRENIYPGLLSLIQPYKIRYYGPSPSGIGAAKQHCDGTPLTGDLAVRLEAPIGGTLDWNNSGNITSSSFAADINFNGTTGNSTKDSVEPNKATNNSSKKWLADSPDWITINLRQVGARLNVNGLSVNVGQEDLGQEDLGQEDLGQEDLGQEDLGQEDLGQEDLGQEDLGQTELGDVDYDNVISTIDPVSASQPLTATVYPTVPAPNGLTGVTLNWGAPSIGQIRTYTIYRATTPTGPGTAVANVSGAPPVTTYHDLVNSTTVLYNTSYTYFVTATDINSTTSAPSNKVTAMVKHLFITARDKTRVYGDPNPAFDTFPATGLDPGLTGATTCTTTATQDSNVGTYPITCSGLTPVQGVTYTAGTLTITKAPALTIAAVSNTKTYDGTTSAAATPTVTGLKRPKDTVVATETYDTKHFGTGKTLSIWTHVVNDGNGGNNYETPSILTSVNTGVINKAPLTITAATNTKTYDGNITAAAVPIVTGIKPGDTVTGLAETYDTASAGTAKVLTVSPGYTVNDGNSGNNYTVSLATNNTGVINKANPVIVVTPYAVTYTGLAYSATGTATGVLSEPLAGLNLSGTTHINAGTYALDPWTFTDVTGNYNNASGTVSDAIAKAAAAVTLSGLEQTYTGNPLTPTATTVPPGLSYSWTGAPQTNPGSYPVMATVTDINYMGSASGTFVIVPVAPAGLNVLWYTGGVGTTAGGPTDYQSKIQALATSASSEYPYRTWNVTFWASGTMPAAPPGGWNVLVVASEIGGWNPNPDYSALSAASGSIGTNPLTTRIFLTGQDADWHYLNSPGSALFNNPKGFLLNGINWAGSGTGMGLVVLGDVPALSFTGFTRVHVGTDTVVIPSPEDAYPLNLGLTGVGLSNWGESAHTTFTFTGLNTAQWHGIGNAGASADLTTIVSAPFATGDLIPGGGGVSDALTVSGRPVSGSPAIKRVESRRR